MTAKKIIHVHRQLMKQGKPAIIVRHRGKAEHFSRVKIDGPSEVIFDPTKSRQPHVWIETYSEVHGD